MSKMSAKTVTLRCCHALSLSAAIFGVSICGSWLNQCGKLGSGSVEFDFGSGNKETRQSRESSYVNIVGRWLKGHTRSNWSAGEPPFTLASLPALPSPQGVAFRAATPQLFNPCIIMRGFTLCNIFLFDGHWFLADFVSPMVVYFGPRVPCRSRAQGIRHKRMLLIHIPTLLLNCFSTILILVASESRRTINKIRSILSKV